MKLILVILVGVLAGCASKTIMVNCENVKDNYFLCEKP